MRKHRARSAKRLLLAIVCTALGSLPATPVTAEELYAQAIGQPPEREEAPPAKQPVPPPPREPLPSPEAQVRAPPPAEGNLRTRIAIGAAVALALAALGGNGGGGTEGAPASTPATTR